MVQIAHLAGTLLATEIDTSDCSSALDENDDIHVKKGKNEVSLKNYLQWKIEAREKEAKEKKQMWEEQKELKRAEINVLSDLVKAIAKRKRSVDNSDSD